MGIGIQVKPGHSRSQGATCNGRRFSGGLAIANIFTAPSWIRSKPHAASEKQVGDSDPSARTDVINRVDKGLYAAIRRLANTLYDGITLDLTDQTTVTAYTNAARGQQGHFFGLTLSNNVGDATNDIDVAVGEAMSDDAALSARVLMELTTGITKRLDAAWAVGTNQGGLDTGVVGNNTYHLWLIERPDTAVVDWLFSLSATAPTMPTNYTKKQYLGSIVRTGGAIKAFTQDRDYFVWADPPLDVDISNPGTSAVSRTLTVPTGRNVEAICNIRTNSGAGTGSAVYVSDLAANDEAASSSAGPLYTVGNTGVNSNGIALIRVRTNTSAQIRTRNQESDVDHITRIATLGWVDRRGRG